MKRADCIKALYPELQDKLVVTIMGACAQELYDLGHCENFFYLQHAMGLASSIGLGLALIGRELDRQQQCRHQRQHLGRQEITPLYRQLYPDAPLASLLGVGTVSAATYMAFIQDIRRFPTISAFCKWCGIVPRSNQSGESQTQGLGITQAGPNLVKATLYQNAEVARQWDVQIAQVYYTQIMHYGKHHTQAVCACASHLARRIYALLTQNRLYELRDPDGRPITQKESRQMILDRFQVPESVRQRRRTRQRTTH